MTKIITTALIYFTIAFTSVVAADLDKINKKFYKVETDNYSIATTVSKKFAYRIADHMEEIHKEYRDRLSNIFGEEDVEKFRVVVFDKQSNYLRALGDKVRGTAGIFMSNEQLLAGFVGKRPPSALFKTLYHEGFHQFLFHYIGPNCPIWLNEGLAQYFSEATWTGNGYRVGDIPPHRIYTLKREWENKQWMSLEKLLSLTNSEWMGMVEDQSPRSSLIYNQTWLFVHFLIDGANGKYRDNLEEYLEDIADDEDSYEAFTDHFSANFTALRNTLYKYLNTLEPSPKFMCMKNMGIISRLLKFFIEKGGADIDTLENIEDVHELFVNSGWKMQMKDGTTLTNRKEDAIEALFHCPLDKSDKEKSYKFRVHKDSGLPQITCPQHPGQARIISRFFNNKKTGTLDFTISEQLPTKH